LKKIIIVISLLIFGLLCLCGVVTYTDFLVRRNKSISEARKAEYEKKFMEVAEQILLNNADSVVILEGISYVWSSAIDNSLDFNTAMKVFMESFCQMLWMESLSRASFQAPSKQLSPQVFPVL
jgi:hypothetical protein